MSKRDPRILVVFASIFAIGSVFAVALHPALAIALGLCAALSAGEAYQIKTTEKEGKSDGGAR